ncbi:hypothetical protein ACFX10_003018 [Malus domestica]
MFLDQKDTKAAKEVAKTMEAKAYSSTKKIKRLKSELVALKGFNISTPISLQLKTTCQKIIDLKTKLDAIQVTYESTEKEIGCYIPQIQDLERAISELRSAAYAKDEELIAAYNQVIHFKKIVNRLEPQGPLKINESLKNEVDELQHVHVGLLEENEQLKVEEVGAQAGAAGGEAPDDAAAENVVAPEGVATKSS